MNLTRQDVLNMPSGEEIRDLAATLVMGWNKQGNWWVKNRLMHTVSNWTPDVNILNAFWIIETFDRKHWDISISSFTDNDGEVWEVSFFEYFEDGVGRHGKAEAETAPLAITRAAIIALGTEAK